MPVFGTDRLTFFYCREPVVTALIYHEFYDFGHYRSELSWYKPVRTGILMTISVVTGCVITPYYVRPVCTGFINP